VFTNEGDALGWVQDMRGEHFQVHGPTAPDYWLSADLVASAAAQQLFLIVDSDHLYEYTYRFPHTMGDRRAA
jgi:hypothetical protein